MKKVVGNISTIYNGLTMGSVTRLLMMGHSLKGYRTVRLKRSLFQGAGQRVQVKGLGSDPYRRERWCVCQIN
jgi:hypothetical protein